MILYSHEQVYDPFDLFDKVVVINKPEEMNKDGVLILWGGADIGTSLYGEFPNKYGSNYRPSRRDIQEMEMITYAVDNDIPIIGICRGAQLLCVFAGGKLAQHINLHCDHHSVTLHDEGGIEITCNSSHHQMMLPSKDSVILATAGATTGLGEYNEEIYHDRVNEVVYFPTLNGLGIQAHPEWGDCSKAFIEYCRRKIKEYLHG